MYIYRNDKITLDGIVAGLVLGGMYIGYLKYNGLSYEKIYNDIIIGDSKYYRPQTTGL